MLFTGQISRLWRSDSGSTAILFALMMICICAGAGLAIDYSRITHLEASMQTAMDAAVLAAVKHEEEDQQSVATAVFYENLQQYAPPMTLAFSNPDAGQFSGVATTKLGMTLMGVLGYSNVGIKTLSTAAAESGGKVCVLLVSPNASQALLVNSGAVVDAPDCEIHVRSTAKPAAIFNASSNLDTKRICIAGSQIIDNGGTHPNTETSCDAASDPYAGKYPDPASATCDENNKNYNGGTITLKPGVYCGWTNFNSQPNVNFDPGVYVIKNGGWNVNGGIWTGTGVTFFFADQSKIQFNSAVTAALTAPASGAYKGVIIFEKPGLSPSPFVLDDSKGMNLTGLIYLPSRDTIFNSASNLTSKNFTMVLNTLILDDTNWNLDSTDTEIATGGTGGVARLVN